MSNNYSALVKTGQEPEDKVNPSLKISSIGTEVKKNSSQMPDGSALLTNTGNHSSLKNRGINYIIHAVPRPRSSCASDEEFIEIAVKAAQNSIILADREGQEAIDELAICLIGGEIYRGSCSSEKLAEGIIRGGGISGAICKALGAEASSVDQQRKGLMKKFNSLAHDSQENDDDTAKDNKYKIKINGLNPVFQTEKDKRQFEAEDFIEIEEIKNSNGQHSPVQDNDNNHNQNGNNQNDNENNDKGQKPNHDNGSNDNNPNKKKDKKTPAPTIPNSVKEYFRENKVKSIELEGEN
ncbi:8016_t:CDS:2 [Funneliformis geosporum]|nr:8016_t:CDS:2 [Funneliformis geosporum]